MTEILFVLMVIFVAYVFYVIAGDQITSIKSVVPEKEPVVKKEALPAPLTVTKTLKTASTKPTVTTKKGLKNPATGEIASSYSQYMFTKRWIKEALVTEGLLEKIYKNNELNPEIEARIKAAIAQLENLPPYKV